VDNTHAGAVRGLRALDDGRWIASGGSDCTVRIWSVPNGSDRVEVQEQWLDTRSAAVQAGWYGNKDVVPFRGPCQLSFSARQEVRCIAGFSVDSIFAGDASGRIYSLALEPGIGQF
jgi:WD40 repeat protein